MAAEVHSFPSNKENIEMGMGCLVLIFFVGAVVRSILGLRVLDLGHFDLLNISLPI